MRWYAKMFKSVGWPAGAAAQGGKSASWNAGRALGLFAILCLSIVLLGGRPAVAETRVVNAYCTTESIALPGGETLEKVTISGPPEPPNLVAHQASIITPEEAAAAVMVDDVPAFSWSFGCSATSAAMIAGYYDRNGYSNMYTGSANGGVMPLNNDEYWTTWVDSCSATRNRCPLAATQQGLDGRTTYGHVDDYWVCYDSTTQDPFITASRTEHTLGDCTADFMGTNQSSSPMSNSDGSTTFWYNTDGSKLTAAELYSAGSTYYDDDGMYGIKEFYESRGYTVTEAYSQYIYGYNGNTLGFTLTQYQAEIDANRPVIIQVSGHTMVGVGYDSESSTIYIHDTWDHTSHSMTWGGSYSGMAHYGVAVVTLDPNEAEGKTTEDMLLFTVVPVNAAVHSQIPAR